MTVFLSFAPADRPAAEALEAVIERRGQFVELDDGQTAQRPVMSNDAVVLLLSKDFPFAPMRLRLEQRALDAWASQRLILVKLDHSFAPVGLRDLPAIDASFEAQREFKWLEIAEAIRKTLTAARAAPQAPAGAPAPPWADEVRELDQQGETQSKHRDEAEGMRRSARGASKLGLLFGVLLMLPGLGALAVSAAIWLANRIGPTPGTFEDLVRGIDQFGIARGVPGGLTPALFAFAIALTVLTPIALFVLAQLRRGKVEAYAREHPEVNEDYEAPPGPPRTDAVFVSYARANSDVVMPVIEGASEAGRKFWIDQQGIVSGDSWAGEIVRAIKNAAGVVIMCSKAAFESDHVKREVYLADRYHKRLVPVFIEDAAPPEDFEYFFAGVQALKLFETPEPDRPEALSRALGGDAAPA